MDFDSLNPYQNMISLSGETPDELIQEIKKIKTPITIFTIIPFKNKCVAYITGDLRTPKTKKGKA